MRNEHERDMSGTLRRWLALPVLAGFLVSGLMACAASEVKASLLKQAMGTWVCSMSVDKSEAPDSTGFHGLPPQVYDVVVTIGEELDVAAGGDAGVGKALQVTVDGQGTFSDYHGTGEVFIDPPFQEKSSSARTLSIQYRDSFRSDSLSSAAFPPNDVQGLDDSLSHMTLGQIANPNFDQAVATGVRMPLQIQRKSSDHVIIGYVDPNPYYVKVTYGFDCLKGSATGSGTEAAGLDTTTVPPLTVAPDTTVPPTTEPRTSTTVDTTPSISLMQFTEKGLEIFGSGFGNVGPLPGGDFPCIAIIDVTQGASAGHIDSLHGADKDGMTFGQCVTKLHASKGDPVLLIIEDWRDDHIVIRTFEGAGFEAAALQRGDVLQVYISNGIYGGEPDVAQVTVH